MSIDFGYAIALPYGSVLPPYEYKKISLIVYVHDNLNCTHTICLELSCTYTIRERFNFVGNNDNRFFFKYRASKDTLPWIGRIGLKALETVCYEMHNGTIYNFKVEYNVY